MLKNMKIGKKLILTFLLVTMISSVAGVIGLVRIIDMDASYSNALVNYGFSQGDVGRFNAEFASSRSYVKDLIIYTDPKGIQSASDNIDKSNVKINQYLAVMQKTMVNEKEIGYYNTIKDGYAKYIEVENKAIALAKQNKNTEAFTLIKSEGTPIADKVKAAVDSLVTLKTATGNQLSKDLSTDGDIAKISVSAIILVSLMLSFFIALTIARGISRPVEKISAAAQRMAKGDLSVEISEDHSANEIAQLSTAFAETVSTLKAYILDIKMTLAKMADGDLNVAPKEDFRGDFEELKYSIDGIVTSFNDALTQMAQASEQVSSGASQVSDGAQELAQGATEQASSIEELSASITEISTQVKENADHAVTASKNVNHVRSEIEVSNQHMNDMVSAMAQISDSSSQIGKIIKTIEDIAFQTNILALNAAVEAARAGAAGKGFAVVADEVRNLASKSAEAAKNTTTLIENSMRQVENGTQIADETAKSLLRVVESAGVVADTVGKISQASEQQADSIIQVTLGVDQISSVVQTNSATAEQSAAASEELSGQAQMMQSLVGRFKLKKQAGTSETVQPAPQQAESGEVYSNSSKY